MNCTSSWFHLQAPDECQLGHLASPNSTHQLSPNQVKFSEGKHLCNFILDGKVWSSLPVAPSDWFYSALNGLQSPWQCAPTLITHFFCSKDPGRLCRPVRTLCHRSWRGPCFSALHVPNLWLASTFLVWATPRWTPSAAALRVWSFGWGGEKTQEGFCSQSQKTRDFLRSEERLQWAARLGDLLLCSQWHVEKDSKEGAPKTCQVAEHTAVLFAPWSHMRYNFMLLSSV